MMEKSKKYLSDIIMAIDLIQNFVADTPDFDSYQNDLKTQSAIERQLAITGEALNKLKQLEPDLLIQNDRQVIGFRNRLIHAYDSIDNAIVWVIIKRHLPELQKEIQNLSE
ncbi:HepT-like ribonuclease domain-containing protein [Salinimicrobium xinjiangense]|uniref:HepT-like ribonuclease domain-containing protein n=1 Tax=Salinimicrobium xinjiangense TaxID=438596 RepID=UPI00048AD1FB|nr:HepT-like ribonuclease domain-containing protein [Salinimicrobium xinjiangense]